MVSFSCENCGDILTKKKLDPHRNQCRGASFTCIDCMVHFHGTEYRSHTSCISEAQKYQGHLYKEKKGKNTSHSNSQNSQNQMNESSTTTPSKPSESSSTALVTRKTIIEEYTSTAVAIVDAPPEAPEPPPNVNVFDFLVGNGGAEEDEWESDRDEDDMHPEPSSSYESTTYATNGYSYGSAPVEASDERHASYADLNKQNGNFVTPAPRKGHSRNISTDSTTKKSGKRKRGHPEDLDLTKTDVVMTDVPPSTLHSGLTGGMHKLLASQRNTLPPSPDLSTGATSPQSPLKRSKHSREHRSKSSHRRRSDSDNDKHRKRSKREEVVKVDRHGRQTLERRRTRKRSASPVGSPNAPAKKQLKAIEYPGHSSQQEEDTSRALVRIEHAPTTKSVDMFLNCLVKGSDTDEGVSLYKALKRWRRDGGHGEKDLWKRLKVRANGDGDLVICV